MFSRIFAKKLMILMCEGALHEDFLDKSFVPYITAIVDAYSRGLRIRNREELMQELADLQGELAELTFPQKKE